MAFGSIGRNDDTSNNRYLLDDAKLKRTRIPTIAELPEHAPPPPPAVVEAPKQTDVLRSMLAQARWSGQRWPVNQQHQTHVRDGKSNHWAQNKSEYDIGYFHHEPDVSAQHQALDWSEMTSQIDSIKHTSDIRVKISTKLMFRQILSK